MEKNAERIYIFDTTLRDGEQVPGCQLNQREKLEIARQLARLNVDVIEAGFPISSPGELEAVQLIAREVQGPVITALARSKQGDIDTAFKAVKEAENKRIHVFLATSEIHRKHKFNLAKDKIIEKAVWAVKYAKEKTDDVEFSPEDASRTEPDFLAEVVEQAIEAGATVINIPDTVGYALPTKFAWLIKYLSENVANMQKTVLSVHCHNDLGLAVANSLAALENGARQVECTINGLGERAGNASLEEIVMALRTHKGSYNLETGINTKEIMRTSNLVKHLMGMPVQANKAIVGANAFAHSSGVHQDGILKHRETYEIMRPEDIGLEKHQMVLTARSGKHAVKNRLQELGIELSEEEFKQVYEMFKIEADKKKQIFNEDLYIFVQEVTIKLADPRMKYYLERIGVFKDIYEDNYLATIVLSRDGKLLNQQAKASGAFNALFDATDKIIGIKLELTDFQIKALTETREAIADAYIRASIDDFIVGGTGSSVDTLKAGVKSYVEMCNRVLCLKENGKMARSA